MAQTTCPTCHGSGVVEGDVAAYATKATAALARIISRSQDRPKERGIDRLARDNARAVEAGLDAKFGLPDGRRVAWRDATAEDLKEWIAMLNRQSDGIQISIAIAERGLAELAATGATRIGELPREAQARIFAITSGQVDDRTPDPSRARSHASRTATL